MPGAVPGTNPLQSLGSQRPEMLLDNGPVRAVQAACALGMLAYPDNFFAALSHAIAYLQSLVAAQLIETDAIIAGKDTGAASSSVSAPVGIDDAPSIAALVAKAAASTTSTTSAPPASAEFMRKDRQLREWLAGFKDTLPTSVFEPKHFAPLVTKLKRTKRTKELDLLNAALALIPVWDPYVSYYSGVATAAEPVVPARVEGYSLPLNIVDDAAEFVVDVNSVECALTLPLATAPSAGCAAQSFVSAVAASPQLDITAPPGGWTTLLAAGVGLLTFDGVSGIVAAAGQFGTAAPGQVLRVEGAETYTIHVDSVISADAVYCADSIGIPGGAYAVWARHYPGVLTLQVTAPEAGIWNQEFNAPVAYGAFIAQDLIDAVTAQSPILTAQVGGGVLSVGLTETGAGAHIVTKNVGTGWSSLYALLGVAAGTDHAGTTGTDQVAVTCREGTAAAALPAGTYTPSELAAWVNTAPEAEPLLSYVDASVVSGQLRLQGKEAGDTEWLEVAGLGSGPGRVWGDNSGLPVSANPLVTFLAGNTGELAQKVLVATGTAIVTDLSFAGITTAWAVGVRRSGEKHWAYYRVLACNPTTGAVQLSAVPAAQGETIHVRPVLQRLYLEDRSPQAASALEVHDTPQAVQLGMAGAIAVGTTLTFGTAAGPKAGDVAVISGQDYELARGGIGWMQLSSAVPAQATTAALYVRGARQRTETQRLLGVSLPAIYAGSLKAEFAAYRSALVSLQSAYVPTVTDDFTHLLAFVKTQALDVLEKLLQTGDLAGLLRIDTGTMLEYGPNTGTSGAGDGQSNVLGLIGGSK